jgi:SAM-dependent methyltransferase
LEVASRKPVAEKVRWVRGDASAAAALDVDLITMTGNVAQVFDDDEWHATLAAARAALRPGGRLVFETRLDRRRRGGTGWRRSSESMSPGSARSRAGST